MPAIITPKSLQALIDKHGDQATQDANRAAKRKPGERFFVRSGFAVEGKLATNQAGDLGVVVNADASNLSPAELEAALDFARGWSEVGDTTIRQEYYIEITRDSSGATADG